MIALAFNQKKHFTYYDAATTAELTQHKSKEKNKEKGENIQLQRQVL